MTEEIKRMPQSKSVLDRAEVRDRSSSEISNCYAHAMRGALRLISSCVGRRAVQYRCGLAQIQHRQRASYAEMLEQSLRKKAAKDMLSLQPREVPDTEADGSAVIENTGYRPVVSVEEGVGNFVRWYRGYYGVDA
jgi:nucleoside-diphosphate-sugar epimerase